MRLVQRHFQYPRDHLRAPGRALSRGVDHGQSRRRHPASVAHVLHNFRRRRAPAFDDEGGDIGFIPIADVLKYRFLLRERPSRAGPESEECVFANTMRQAPTRVLAPEARDDRLGEVTAIVQGQRGVELSGPSRTAPRPPRQISAMRSPASTPPRCFAPASIKVSPSGPRATPRFRTAASRLSAAVSSAARRLTLMTSASLNGPPPERGR